MGRTVATGIQDFSEIREKNLFYVDKTSFIKEWWESNDKVTLITRPRRFGKTLTMSMAEQFFSTAYAGRGDLFEGLDIWKEEKYRKLQGTYPVVSLSFSRFKGSSFETVKRGICGAVLELYNKHDFLLGSGCLNENEKELFGAVSRNMSDDILFSSLRFLSDCLQRYYGKKVIILLDEYDTPMQEAFVNDYWTKILELMRGLLNATFKTNPFLERGIMTGIARVSKESVFSDLNNLKVITVTSKAYADSFGFTEREVFDALEEFGLEDRRDGIKEWYDGFRFGDCGNIYNPWSVTEFLGIGKFAPYWANTSSNELADKLIREGGRNIKLVMEDLLNGAFLSTQIDEQVVFDQLGSSEPAVWSLLLAGGYLKVVDYELDEVWGETTYDLALTNKEVHIAFRKLIRNWFAGSLSSYNGFITALLNDDKEAMNVYMNEVALATFSAFDSGTKPSKRSEPERFYHGFVLGLLVDLNKIYSIKSNRESGLGRCDVALEPKPGAGGGHDGIILEFKVHDPGKEKTLQDTAENALKQIIEKRYAASLEMKGVSSRRIRIYGFAFEGVEVLIDGGYLGEIASNLEPAGSAEEAPAGKISAF